MHFRWGHPQPAWHWLVGNLVAAAVLFQAAASAQPVPKLNSVSPEYVQRGASVDLLFAGDDLARTISFLVSGEPGIRIELISASEPAVQIQSSKGGISAAGQQDNKNVSARLTVAPDAPLGSREVRAVTPDGVSNPITLHVGHLPEIAEIDAHQSAEQAQSITLPVAVTGRISAPAEVDHFRFRAQKGQHLVFEVYASRLGSPMDSSLVLSDASGKELAKNEDGNGLDSLLDFKVPAEGEYFLQLRDFRYQGGATYRYRLLAGVLPYVESTFPFGARRGDSVELQLRGFNLGSSKLRLHIAPDAPIGRQELRAQLASGISNPFPFEVGDAPEITEIEPNTEKPNAIPIPSVVNGRIQGEKDSDSFVFKAEKNQSIVFEVVASRFGSPLDVRLTLMTPQGTVLERNDDAAGADARIEYRFSEAGDFVVKLQDLLERNGDSFAYRLSAKQPEPTFSVRFQPDNPRVYRGSRTPLRVEVSRRNGFSEPVRISLDELPLGLHAEPLVLDSGTTAGWMMLSANSKCPTGPFPLKVAASANGKGSPLRVTAEPVSSERAVRQGFVSVLDHAPFTIETATLATALEQNASADIDVLLQRHGSFNGEVKLTVDGFSSGREPITRSFDVEPLTLKPNENRGRIKLKAKPNAEIGTRLAMVKGEGVIDGQTNTQYSVLFPLAVHQIPFILSSTLKRLSVTVLPSGQPSSASEAQFAVRAERRAGFTNEIALKLDGLPDGIIAEVPSIAPNSNESNLKLTATNQAAAGKEFTLRVHGSGLFHDRTYRYQTEEIKLITVAPETSPELTGATATE